MSSAGRSRGASIVSQARSVAMITHHLGGDIRGGCFLDDGCQFTVTPVDAGFSVDSVNV